MSYKFNLNFDGLNDKGFVVIRPGRYVGKIVDWRFYVKEETANALFQLEFELVGSDYAGKTIRFWQSIGKSDGGNTITSTPDDAGRVYRLYKNLGLVMADDRQADKPLDLQAVFGAADENGKLQVTHLSVNGDKRPVTGAKATLVIVESQDTDGNPSHSIKYVDSLSVTPDGKSSDIPF